MEQALAKGVTPRAMVVINPGNPTGQCLDPANMRQVCGRVPCVVCCVLRGRVLCVACRLRLYAMATGDRVLPSTTRASHGGRSVPGQLLHSSLHLVQEGTPTPFGFNMNMSVFTCTFL